MTGLVIVLIILLAFTAYISLQRQAKYDKSVAAADRIIQADRDSEAMLQQILKSSQLALKTDNPTDSQAATMDAINAYNTLAATHNQCQKDVQIASKYPDTDVAVQIPMVTIQGRLTEGKLRVDDAVRYVESLIRTTFDMARCRAPCYYHT